MPFKKMIGAIRRADVDYQLINDGDRICVGVSGGKDSVLLLLALSEYRRVAKNYDGKSFEVIGIHLEMGFPSNSFEPIANFAKEHGIEYVDYPTRIYDILKLYPNEQGEISCSRCSSLKKGAIVKAAQEYHCNKVAFAHHGDDAIETLFMNMIHGARIAVFTPAMHLSRANMDFIRPFVYVFEDQIRATAEQELQIPIIPSGCPNDGHTDRQEVKEMLVSIYEKYPYAHLNFLKSLSNEDQLKLWVKGLDWRMDSETTESSNQTTK